MSYPRRAADGFTLFEVMVALVIGGLALAGAAGLLQGLGGRAERVANVAANADRDANAERLLRSLLANLELSSDSAPSLLGNGDSASFRAWCEVPAGWLDHCVVRLAFEHSGGVSTLRLRLAGALTSNIELRRDFQIGRFRYLTDPRHGGTWTPSWAHLVPPAAVALIVDRDTTLLTVWSGG